MLYVGRGYYLLANVEEAGTWKVGEVVAAGVPRNPEEVLHRSDVGDQVWFMPVENATRELEGYTLVPQELVVAVEKEEVEEEVEEDGEDFREQLLALLVDLVNQVLPGILERRRPMPAVTVPVSAGDQEPAAGASPEPSAERTGARSEDTASPTPE